MGLIHLMLLGAMVATCETPVENNVTDNRKLEIPIHFKKDRDKISDLLMFSSTDGKRWEQFAVVKANQDSVTFNAPEDGLYMFQMVVVFKDGHKEPEDPRDPDAVSRALKIIVDTKPPVIAIRTAEKIGDEVTVSWEIVEENPDLSTFALEYKGADGEWDKVQGINFLKASTARFRISTTDKLQVRVKLKDLTGAAAEVTKDVVGSGKPIATPINLVTANTETRAPIGVIPNSTPNMPLPSLEGPSVKELTPPVAPNATLPALSTVDAARNDYSPAPPINSSNSTTQPALNTVAATPSVPNNPTGAQLPAAQIINVWKFDLGYDIEGKGASDVSRAELWVTRDEGKTWIRWAVSDKADGKFPVNLERIDNRANPTIEGMYGFKIVLVSGAGLTKGAPISGEIPEIRIDVDTTAPVLKLFEPIPDPNQPNTLILKWHAVDRNMSADPISIEWAESAEGPWYSVHAEKSEEEASATGIPLGTAKRLANTGSYGWKLPKNFPHAKVYLRISARDTAGNLAEIKTKEPVLIDMSRPSAKIVGITGTSGAEKK